MIVLAVVDEVLYHLFITDLLSNIRLHSLLTLVFMVLSFDLECLEYFVLGHARRD